MKNRTPPIFGVKCVCVVCDVCVRERVHIIARLTCGRIRELNIVIYNARRHW